MNPQQQNHYLLQTCYYISFALALAGGIATLGVCLYAIKETVTLSFDHLQWGGPLFLSLLVGVPSALLCLLNFKLENTLRQHGAQGSWLLDHSKKMLLALIIAASICFGACIAIGFFRLDFLHK